MSLLLAALLPVVARTVFADGAWASFDRGRECAAVSRALRVATNGATQGAVALTFDRSGSRLGQLSVRLSRPPRAGSTVVLTIGDRPSLLVPRDGLAWSAGPLQESAIVAQLRVAPAMRIEAQGDGGGRFADRYALDGAPGAVDAAAACAARR